MNIDEQLSRLIEAEKAVGAEQRITTRGWKRLARAATLGTPSLAIAHTTIPLTTASMVAEATAIALVVGAVGAAIIVGTAPRDPSVATTPSAVSASSQTPVPSSVRSTSKRAPAATASSATIQGTEDEGVLAVVPISRPRATPSQNFVKAPVLPSAIPGPLPSSLEDELRLISQAKREVDRGAPQLAASWLTEHQTRFPVGILSAEREGLRVLMACGDIASTDSQVLAAQYASRYPGSPLLDRIRRACLKAANP